LCWRLGTKPLGESSSGLDTTWSMLLRERRLSRSFAGRGGREDEFEPRPCFASIGGSGFSVVETIDSGSRGISGAPGGAPGSVSKILMWMGFNLPTKLFRFTDLPLLFGVSEAVGECSPSSSVSLIVGASLSRRLLAALRRLKLLASASLSLRLRSFRFAFRSSFSSSKAHQPAKASHRCARTFSMTISMSTPAARIRCSTSFSNSVEKGAGCCSFSVSCWRGACSDNHGFCSMSARVGRKLAVSKAAIGTTLSLAVGSCPGIWVLL
jgi:hypothetical protein